MAVSRYHLRLFCSNGAWYCADAGSSNGTLVDGQRLGDQAVPLRGEAEIRFGTQVWRIKTNDRPGMVTQASFDKGDGKSMCRRCGAPLGLFGGAAAALRSGLCKGCGTQVTELQSRFQQAFKSLVRTRPLLGTADIQEVHQLASRLGLPISEALLPLRADCVGVLYRQLAIAKQDGIIEPSEEDLLRRVQQGLYISDSDAAYVWKEVGVLKKLHEIRTGQLSPVRASMVLPPGEICYHEDEAVYHRELASGTRYVRGKFLITSKRVVFLAIEGGFEFSLGKIATVEVAGQSGVMLGLTRKQGAGYYQTNQPELVSCLLERLLDRHHRLSDLSQASGRNVPQHVKAEVWARDGGQCVQCKATEYLEFDHVIPFSMGGATSTENLQLLCRACNLAKGGRL